MVDALLVALLPAFDFTLCIRDRSRQGPAHDRVSSNSIKSRSFKLEHIIIRIAIYVFVVGIYPYEARLILRDNADFLTP